MKHTIGDYKKVSTISAVVNRMDCVKFSKYSLKFHDWY
jgi:hypothetical protein